MSTKIRIPEKHVIQFQGRKNRNGDAYLLGYMVPYEDGEKKAIQNASSWASKGRVAKKALKNKKFVLENKPIEGVKLLDVISRWSTDNKVWRVKDPRGDFQLEIYSGNLQHIIQNTTIKNGVIQEKCVWGRDNTGKNYLLVKGSDLHKEARNYQDIRSTRISLRDVNRGDIVKIHDGRTVRYYGGMHFLKNLNSYSSSTSRQRHYVFKTLEGEGHQKYGVGEWDTKSSLKVGEIIDDTNPLSKQEAEDEANNALLGGKFGYKTKAQFFHSHKFRLQDMVLSLNPLEDQEKNLDVEEGTQIMFFYDSDGLYQMGRKREKGYKIDEQGLLQKHTITHIRKTAKNHFGRRNKKKVSTPYTGQKLFVLKAKVGSNDFIVTK